MYIVDLGDRFGFKADIWSRRSPSRQPRTSRLKFSNLVVVRQHAEGLAGKCNQVQPLGTHGLSERADISSSSLVSGPSEPPIQENKIGEALRGRAQFASVAIPYPTWDAEDLRVELTF